MNNAMRDTEYLRNDVREIHARLVATTQYDTTDILERMTSALLGLLSHVDELQAEIYQLKQQKERQ